MTGDWWLVTGGRVFEGEAGSKPTLVHSDPWEESSLVDHHMEDPSSGLRITQETEVFEPASKPKPPSRSEVLKG